jgi:hypothetical protein
MVETYQRRSARGYDHRHMPVFRRICARMTSVMASPEPGPNTARSKGWEDGMKKILLVVVPLMLVVAAAFGACGRF